MLSSKQEDADTISEILLRAASLNFIPEFAFRGQHLREFSNQIFNKQLYVICVPLTAYAHEIIYIEYFGYTQSLHLFDPYCCLTITSHHNCVRTFYRYYCGQLLRFISDIGINIFYLSDCVLNSLFNGAIALL